MKYNELIRRVFFSLKLSRKKTDKRIVSTEKILCFMTFYEYFDCFYRVMHLIRDIIRMQRISAAANHPELSLEARILAEIEFSAEFSDNTRDIEPLLINLYNTDMEICNMGQIVISPTLEGLVKYTYNIPKSSEISKNSASFFCPLLFSSLNLDSFYDVLCSIYLEHCVIFVSENLNILTSSMYCFLRYDIYFV